MDNSLDERTNLFKVRKTVCKMLEDRGYIVTIKDKNETLETFKRDFKSIKDLLIIAPKSSDPSEHLYVEFSDNAKLGVTDISNFAETLHKEGVKTGIIINKGSITPLAKMVLKI